MNRILVLIFFISIFLTARGQKILSETEINNIISEKLLSSKQNLKNLKDSVSFYGFAIELKISKNKNSTIVHSISTNDSVANLIYDNFDFLKKINYSNILKKRKYATLVIPIGIIIAYVKNPITPVPLLNAEQLMPELAKFFNKDFKKNNQLSSYIYLDPIICLGSTKIYD